MTTPSFAINPTVTQSGTLQLAGVINLPLTLSKYTLPTTAAKNLPRFFGNDGTGCYYGLGGYYASLPCYSNPGTHLYQYGAFNINATGMFDVSSLISNPFAYSPQLTSYGSIGSLPYPIDTVSAGAPAGVQSRAAIRASKAVLTSSGNVPYQWTQDNAFYPNLSFASHNTVFSNRTIVQTDTTNNAVIGRCTAFTVTDDFNSEYFVDTFSQVISATIPIACNPSIYPGTPFPVIIQKNGSLKAVDTGGASYQMKVNPKTGNALYTHNNSLYSYNAFANVSTDGSGNYTISPKSRYLLSFSDPGDNSNMSVIYGIQQIPGGGWIVTSYPNGKCVVVTPDMQSYYRVNFFGFIPPLFSLAAEAMGVDINGFFYCLSYTGQTYNGIYSSMGGPATVQLVSPSLTSIINSCRVFNPCTLTFEG